MALAIPSEQPLPVSPSTFLLRKINTVPNICIHLDFAPYPQTTASLFMPRFNRDGKHFTPSFILPIDKVPIPLFSRATRITARRTWGCTFESGSRCNNKNQF